MLEPTANTGDPISRIDGHDLDMVAYQADSNERANGKVYEIDIAMRRNYAQLKSGLITVLSPVIVIENDPHGGKFTLILNGKRETVRPVRAAFELAKSVCHIPLGIFSIIAPYLKTPAADGWQIPLANFKNVIHSALDSLKLSSLPANGQEASTKIISLALNFIDNALKFNRFTINEFTSFTGSASEAIQENMKVASEAQITGIRSLITLWRKQIGEEQWKDLYTIILAIWTTSERNQAAVIMKTLMAKDRIADHLITISTAELPSDPIAVALDNLARIVQDNVAAELVFPKDQQIADALAGMEDLLSDTIESIMLCPYRNIGNGQ